PRSVSSTANASSYTASRNPGPNQRWTSVAASTTTRASRSSSLSGSGSLASAAAWRFISALSAPAPGSCSDADFAAQSLRQQARQRRAELVLRRAPRDLAGFFFGAEVPGLAEGGHPDFAGGVVTVDDDALPVGEREREDALRQLDLELVGVEIAERFFQVAQLGVGDQVEVIFCAHGGDATPPPARRSTARRGENDRLTF